MPTVGIATLCCARDWTPGPSNGRTARNATRGRPAQERRLSASLDLLVDVSERAYASGVFGVPTFIVGSELYFGNDRLDFAIEAFSEKLATDTGLQLRG